ncbi:uncharacterized protein [Ptychodera flava]|uniref:uncharacterized protein n=1 Tax=Ptychodera flava TaxID=63121 RepID=UPI003969F246
MDEKSSKSYPQRRRSGRIQDTTQTAKASRSMNASTTKKSQKNTKEGTEGNSKKSETASESKGVRKARLKKQTKAPIVNTGETNSPSKVFNQQELPSKDDAAENAEVPPDKKDIVPARMDTGLNETPEVSEVTKGQKRKVSRTSVDSRNQICEVEESSEIKKTESKRGRKRKVDETLPGTDELKKRCKRSKGQGGEEKALDKAGDGMDMLPSKTEETQATRKRTKMPNSMSASKPDHETATGRSRRKRQAKVTETTEENRNEVEGRKTVDKRQDAERTEDESDGDDEMKERRKRWVEEIKEFGYAKCDTCKVRRQKLASIEKHYNECLKKVEEKKKNKEQIKGKNKNGPEDVTKDGTDDTAKEEQKNVDINTAKKIWADQIAENGRAKCMKCFITRLKISSMEKHYLDCVTKSPVNFNCQHCPRVFQTAAGYKYHLLVEHSGIQKSGKVGSEKSESSENDDANENLVIRAYLKKRGKIKCPTEGCHKTFTTIGGYQYHVQRCGTSKVQESYKCEKCGKEYHSMAGLKYHMQSVHPAPPTAEEIEKAKKKEAEKAERLESNSLMISPAGRVRRQAAIRAVNKVQQLAETGVMEDDDRSKKRKKEKDPDAMIADWSKPLYTKPERPVPSKELMAEWRETLKKKSKVICPYKDCNMCYNNVISLRFHYQCCPKSGVVVENFKCLICGKEYANEASMKYHVQSLHKEELLADAGSDSDEDYDSDVSDASIKTPDDGSDVEVRPYRPRSLQSGDKTLDIKLIPLPEVVAWTLQLHSSFVGMTVHPTWKPMKSDWTKLSKSDAENYEPVSRESIQFQVEVENGETGVKTRLPRYATQSMNKTKTMTAYTGGPVWCMEWCPLPLSVCASKQFVAISCHRHHEAIHHCEKTYQENGMIQLWDFGILDNKTPAKPPHLSLGIAHEYGSIWDMKWCPSGAWEDPGQSENGETARLGLLVVACSDGRLRILSIPHPESICGDGSDYSVYTVKPCAVLESSPRSDLPTNSQSLCVDWSPDKQRRKIAAGFHNGTVILWDLLTTSQLLKTSIPLSPVDTYYPFHSFRAHSSSVSDISWCKTTETFLGTSSTDRNLKFWDLRSTVRPVNCVQIGMMTQCHWPSNWNGCCVGQDNSVTGSHSHVGIHFAESGFLEQKANNLISVNACIWSLSYSSWLNTLVAGDSLGHVLGIVLPNVHKQSVHTKAPFRRRFPIYSLTIEEREKDTSKVTCVDSVKDKSQDNRDELSGDRTSLKAVAMETDVAEKSIKDLSHSITESHSGPGEMDDKNAKISTDRVTMETELSNTHQGEEVQSSEIAVNSDVYSMANRGQCSCTADRTTDKDDIRIVSTSEIDQVCVKQKKNCENCTTQRTKPCETDVPNFLNCQKTTSSVSCDGVELLQSTDNAVRTSKQDCVHSNSRKKCNTRGKVESIDINAERSVNNQLGKKMKSEEESIQNIITEISSCDENVKSSTGAIRRHNHCVTQDNELRITKVTSGSCCRDNCISSSSLLKESDIQEQQRENLDTNSTKLKDQPVNAKGNLNTETLKAEKAKNHAAHAKKENTEGKSKSEGSTKKTARDKSTERQLPSDYADFHENYCLVYKDANLANFTKIHSSESFKRIHGDNLKTYPKPDHFTVESINKVCWNPNLGCHQWLLSGGTAGLVRLHYLQAFKQKDAEKAVQTFSKKQQKRQKMSAEQQTTDGEGHSMEEQEPDEVEFSGRQQEMEQQGQGEGMTAPQQPR